MEEGGVFELLFSYMICWIDLEKSLTYTSFTSNCTFNFQISKKESLNLPLLEEKNLIIPNTMKLHLDRSSDYQVHIETDSYIHQ